MRILSVKLFDGKVQTFQPEFTIFGGAAIGDLQVEFPQERGGRKLLQKLSTASLLREFNLQITDCCPAEDGELGLESLHLTIE